MNERGLTTEKFGQLGETENCGDHKQEQRQLKAGAHDDQPQAQKDSGEASLSARAAAVLSKIPRSKSTRSKGPPTNTSLSLVLPRPLVRPSPTERTSRKGNLKADSAKDKKIETSCEKKLKEKTDIKIKTNSKTPYATTSSFKDKFHNKNIRGSNICEGMLPKTEQGDELELDLRTKLALRKRPMTNSERQLLQIDHKTDWTLWEESCLLD